MALTYDCIASVTLGAAAASITLGSGGTIPQTYTDLILIMNGTTSANDRTIYCRVNGSSLTSYSRINFLTYSTVATKAVQTGSGLQGAEIGNNWRSDTPATLVVSIMRYTGGFCEFLWEESSPSTAYPVVARGVSNSQDIGPLTSIQLLPNSGNFDPGTVVSLFGIKAA